MNERLKEVQTKVVDFWNKYNRKQKTLMISITLAVIALLVVLAVIFNRTDYVTLVECESASVASDVKDALNDAGIGYTISDNYVVKVSKENKVEAEMAIAVSGVVANDYTIEEALSGGMSTTEADKNKKYLVYLEDKLRISLEQLDYVKAARVQLTAPTKTLSVLESEEETTAAVVLKLKSDISSTTAENLAIWIATSIGNDTTSSVTILDTNGNMLFRGTDANEDGYTSGSNAEMELAAMDMVASNVKRLFDEAELYQSVEVSSHLDMSFDTVERVEESYDTGDREQGPYLTSYDVEQEGTSTSGGVPGTDSNDEDITYEITTDGDTTSTYELHKYEYAVNKIVEKTTKARGVINYDDSTLSIVARTYNVYEEETVRKAGLLDDMSWTEFKEQNRDNVSMEVPEDLYSLVSNATGFEEDNITILAYRVPQFVDADTDTNSKGFMDYVPVILAIIIFALLVFVVFRSTRPIEVVETEPELSIEELLSNTKENHPVEDIDLNEKSETRKAIEKFVDENPEAVALLLRNWLDDDWS